MCSTLNKIILKNKEYKILEGIKYDLYFMYNNKNFNFFIILERTIEYLN